ncbi:MAG TPA: LysR family transcriptional regulator [Dokdonella sp.]|uniref:LysR family transcriptional regulator n=1 Tax=Dokdonella sp. TaxID=2291710 RepID=UPI0025C00577|nr:LysR family transcriptional regulator [Dokdonella sp.]MBX3691317.1 LysR family transcriptional regulator [Dokdonella sp.]MCW5569061.1 LysR family transcriptional regulator [Dokdonella sp.]HNR90811.1 LysR family transcriptional regulator [Dokdonella sp.]
MAKTEQKPASRARAKALSGTATPRYYYKGNRLKQLRAFCYTVKFGTLSRAAEALFLSQPSVSLQLGALEQELGAPLLERRRRRVTPTAQGQVLYDLARPLIEGFEGIDEAFRARTDRLGPPGLDIACGNATIQYLLPDMVAAFRARHPEIHLNLANVTGTDGLALLRSDEVDFAVGSMLDVPNDLSYEPLYHFDPLLITPPEHPLMQKSVITLEDLSPYGLILPPKRLTTYRLVDLVFQKRNVPYHVAIEVGGWEVIKQYVAMGLGISIVTGICIGEADRARLGVRNLRQYFPQRSYGVVLRKGKYLSAEARAFIDLIRPGLFTRRDWFDPGHSER